MSLKKIAFFSSKPYDKEFFNWANSRYGFEIKYFEESLNKKNSSLCQGFDVICVFVNDAVSAEVIDACLKNGVRLIALRSAGYDHVDIKAARGKIPIVRVPEYSPHAVAEYAVAMMLTLNRHIHHAYLRTSQNNFTITGLLGFDMHKKTIGVIGAGRIGKAVIEILKGFGMRVIVYDIDPRQVQHTSGSFVELDTLYEESDIITLHCPLTSENVHMINANSIEKMKDGVMLINTGRGTLINHLDLLQALEIKKIGSAGLDVYEGENHYFYQDFSSRSIDDEILLRLKRFPQVLFTAHQAFFTKEAMENIALTTMQNVKDYFQSGMSNNEISVD